MKKKYLLYKKQVHLQLDQEIRKYEKEKAHIISGATALHSDRRDAKTSS